MNPPGPVGTPVGTAGATSAVGKEVMVGNGVGVLVLLMGRTMGWVVGMDGVGAAAAKGWTVGGTGGTAGWMDGVESVGAVAAEGWTVGAFGNTAGGKPILTGALDGGKTGVDDGCDDVVGEGTLAMGWVDGVAVLVMMVLVGCGVVRRIVGNSAGGPCHWKSRDNW